MRHNLFPAGFSSTNQQGFSMLEILITLVIVATALFGTAGLQANAMRMNQGGQFRTQAVFLASDIAERMEANKAEAVTTSNYVVASFTNVVSGYTADCTAVVCSSADLASWDLNQWETAIVNLGLPQASWQITQIQTIPANPPNNPIASATYQIVIRWSDRRTDTTYADYDANLLAASAVGSSADEKSEIFSYTATRTISN